MILRKEDYVRVHNTVNFYVYVNNLDVSKKTKDSIITIYEELRDVLCSEDIFNIINKIVQRDTFAHKIRVNI